MSGAVCAVSVCLSVFLQKKTSYWLQISKNVSIKSCHIFKKNKNGRFIFDFFGSDPSKMDQTWSNLIKLDFLANLKMSLWKVVTFPERIKMAVLFLIFLDQIRPKWIKLDQIGFLTNLKMLLWKVVTLTERIKMTVLFLSFLDQTCPNLIKLDQTWSNLISSPI